MLNPSKAAEALTGLLFVRFREESHWEHSQEYQAYMDEKIRRADPGDLLRFKACGVVTLQFLKHLWAQEFQKEHEAILREVLLRRGIMVQLPEVDQFMVPCCLPKAHLLQPPARTEDLLLYVHLDGFMSPHLFPKLASILYKTLNSPGSGAASLSPGPPQIYSNLVEVRTADAAVNLSLFPIGNPELLRIHASHAGHAGQASPQDQEDLKLALMSAWRKALGIECKAMRDAVDAQDLSEYSAGMSSGILPWLQEMRSVRSVDHFASRCPCVTRGCRVSTFSEKCNLCRGACLLEERFHADLSDELRSLIAAVSLFEHTRPAGSFRFKQFNFPGDVDLAEYVILEARDEAEALEKLAAELQKKFGKHWNEDLAIHWGGLKTGDPRSSDEDKLLTWSREEIREGFKLCQEEGEEGGQNEQKQVDLVDALSKGARGRTAKVDVFAKTSLFQGQPCCAHQVRFFEVTNVLYAGYICTEDASRQVRPLTKDGNQIEYLERGLKEYAAKHAKPMKYVASSAPPRWDMQICELFNASCHL